MEPPSKKTKKGNENNIKTIKTTVRLDDDVVDNIIRFLPIKSAVKVGVTSNRHRNSWKYNLNLNFGKDKVKHVSRREDYITIVDKILSSHEGKVRSFHLYFDPKNQGCKLINWIQIAKSKEVEELDLDFSAGKEEVEFPFHQLACSSIVDLKLSCCQVDITESFGGLGSLRTLALRKVFLNEKMIQIIFRSCLSLEVLDLTQCPGFVSLCISSVRQKGFKMLKVKRCRNLTFLSVDVPTLSSLHYYGHTLTLSGNLSEVKDALFVFGAVRRTPNVKSILSNLSHVKTLTINGTYLKELQQNSRHVCLPTLKSFTLEMQGKSNCHPHDIFLFLCLCPRLENVIIDLNGFNFNCGPAEEKPDKMLAKSNYFFQTLKTVNVKGFKLENYEFQLLKLLLEKAPVLKTVSLIAPRNRRLKVGVKDVQKHHSTFLGWSTSAKVQIFCCKQAKLN